jgi:hypothetical protein
VSQSFLNVGIDGFPCVSLLHLYNNIATIIGKIGQPVAIASISPKTYNSPA